MKPGTLFAILIAILTAVSVSSKAQSIGEYSFHVEVSGTKSTTGKDIILIPGLSSSGDVWDATVEKYQKGHTLHVVTLPGFAGVEPIEFGDSFVDKMGDEIARYIKDNKIDKPVIMGHSLGGFLTLYIASKYPELPSKIISVDGLPFLGGIQNPNITAEQAKTMADAQRAAMKNQPQEAREPMMRAILASMITDPAQQEIAYQWGLNSDDETVGQAMYDLNTIDLRGELANIKTPALVLGAWVAYKQYGVTRDMTMMNFRAQYQHLDGVQIELTDTGRHFIMWDDPEFFFAQLDSFL